MSDFAKQLSKLTSKIAESINSNDSPYIHCSKINSFSILLNNIAPLLGTAASNVKRVDKSSRNAFDTILGVLFSFKQIKSQCSTENCYQFALTSSLRSVRNDFFNMHKDLGKALEILGVIDSKRLIDSSTTEIDSQDQVDIKRIGQIIGQLQTKNSKRSRLDVARHIRSRHDSLKALGVTIEETSDMITIPELPSSLNMVLQHEDFKSDSLIGKGTSGTVFRGTIKQTGEIVAIKILNERLLTHDAIEMFRREVYVMSTLQHPCLLKFCGYTPESPYCLLTSFMKNGSLFHILSQRPDFLTSTNKTLIAYDIACGMEFLHSRGVIHRDLKSLNILIDDKKRGKICDFGFVRIKNNDPMTGLIGTSHWMAPEILLSSPYYDEKVDVYSYGMLLWEIYTNQQPFADMNETSIPVLTTTKNFRPPIPDGMPPKLKKLIEDCWQRDPEGRPSFHTIVTLFMDPEYHFPKSETFLVLRETGGISYRNFPLDPERSHSYQYQYQTKRNLSGGVISDHILIELAKLRETMKQENIESVKKSINRVRYCLLNTKRDFSDMHDKLWQLIINSPKRYIVQLMQVYFEYHNEAAKDSIFDASPMIRVLESSDENASTALLSLLTMHHHTFLNQNGITQSLLRFAESPKQAVRERALNVLIHQGLINPKYLVEHLDGLLKFAVKRVSIPLMIGILQLSILVLDDLKSIDQTILKRVYYIRQIIPDQCTELINRLVVASVQKFDEGFVGLFQKAFDDFETYSFSFGVFLYSKPHDMTLLIKSLLLIAKTNDNAFDLLLKFSLQDEYKLAIVSLLPIQAYSPEVNQYLYINIMQDESSYVALYSNEEFYKCIPEIIKGSSFGLVCKYLKSVHTNINLLQKYQICKAIALDFNQTDDPIKIRSYIIVMSSLIQLKCYDSFEETINKLLACAQSSDISLSQLSFICLVLLSSVYTSVIPVEPLKKLANMFSKSTKGVAQDTALLYLQSLNK